jgi:deoxyribonuclease V
MPQPGICAVPWQRRTTFHPLKLTAWMHGYGKMIAAIDVNYFEDGSALAAAVVFDKFSDETPVSQYTQRIDWVEDYLAGSFYLRELPCILSILKIIEEEIDTIVIDGYVNLGTQPGLGAHLRKATGEKIAVIGVAKSRYAGSYAREVYRGRSKRAVYVSAAGIDLEQAAGWITNMHGVHRIPVLLKAVDRLTKEA